MEAQRNFQNAIFSQTKALVATHIPLLSPQEDNIQLTIT
jgi:hypothetical protein